MNELHDGCLEVSQGPSGKRSIASGRSLRLRDAALEIVQRADAEKLPPEPRQNIEASVLLKVDICLAFSVLVDDVLEKTVPGIGEDQVLICLAGHESSVLLEDVLLSCHAWLVGCKSPLDAVNLTPERPSLL